MWRVFKYGLISLAALIGVLIVAFAYSIHLDQQRFRGVKNPCERDCVQDSGGLEFCRKTCASHPNGYGPNIKQ
jgi:hypothetical protein